METNFSGYRVTYSVMEGDNYAGGWVDHTTDIADLGKLYRFQHIVSVQPLNKNEILGEPLSPSALLEARVASEVNEKKARVEKEVEAAKQKLASATAELQSLERK